MEVRAWARRRDAPGSSPKLNPDMQGCLEWVVNRRECHARVSTKKESFTKNPPGEVKLFLSAAPSEDVAPWIHLAEV